MSRRSLVVAAAALAVIAGLVALLLPAQRHLVGLSSTGPDTALLLTRTYDPAHHWIEHVSAAGQPQWTAELTPFSVPDAFGTAVAATDQLVIVLATAEQDAAVHAFDRTTGARRWQAALPGKTGSFESRGSFVLVDPPHVHVMRFVDDSESTHNRVDTLALADGAAAWTYDTPRHSTMHPAGAGRLFVHTAEGLATILDGATGKPIATLTTARAPCRVPGALVTAQNHEAVVLHDRGGPALHLSGASLEYGGDSLCGARGDDLVLAHRDTATRTHQLVRHDASTGAPRWTLNLGADFPQPIRSADGRLPRMLPFTSGAGDDARLVVVDLDSGKQVHRGRFRGADILVSAEWAVLRPRFSYVLLALDQGTGQLARATEFADASLTDPDDFRDGVLWLRGLGATRRADYPWSILDPNTGTIGHPHGGLASVDRTAEYRAELGQ